MPAKIQFLHCILIVLYCLYPHHSVPKFKIIFSKLNSFSFCVEWRKLSINLFKINGIQIATAKKEREKIHIFAAFARIFEIYDLIKWTTILCSRSMPLLTFCCCCCWKLSQIILLKTVYMRIITILNKYFSDHFQDIPIAWIHWMSYILSVSFFFNLLIKWFLFHAYTYR